MKPLIMDASALLAVALREPGGDKVLAHINEPGATVYMHAINAFR